jgi:hypothetical protein
MQTAETEDRWYVEIAGKVEMMTLDDLVEGYEAGRISAKTLVTEVGGSEWHTLAEVADLPDEDEGPQSMPAPPVAAAPVSRAPVAPSYPPPVSSRESAWPPAAAWGPTSSPVVARSTPGSIAPASFAPLSTAPVVQDLDLGPMDMPFKRSKGKVFMMALAAVGVLGVAGFGITKASMVPPAPAVAVPAAAPLAGPPPASLGDWKTRSTANDPVPAAQPAATTEGDKAEKGDGDSRLSDDVKAKLAEKDKDSAAKKKAARSTRAVRSTRKSSSSGSSGVFRSGGNVNDPLNSKL